MTKALVNLYFMITFLGVSVFSSSFLGILDDHNNGRKEISLARVVGALREDVYNQHELSESAKREQGKSR